MRRSLILAPLLATLIALSAPAAPLDKIELSQSWRIRSLSPTEVLDASSLADAANPDAPEWLPVKTMPAMVHDVLLSHGKIEEPWLPGRAGQVRWVAEKDWIYALNFTAGAPARSSRLRFEGLDTVVDVYLNGEQIASHANMVAPLVVDVDSRLKPENTLVLHFHTVFDPAGDRTKPIQRYKGMPVRRPQQNYGAYLGPRPLFSRVGVWDRIYLEVTDGDIMDEVAAGASLDESLTHGTVDVDVAGQSRSGQIAVAVRLLSPDGVPVGETLATVEAENGRFSARATVAVEKPALWWPRGYGDQPLYRAEVTLRAGAEAHQTVHRTIGFRRVTMPSLLHFVVNGVPVRLWGGDWVVPHWKTAVWDSPRVQDLYRLAENANFNAFRVWGVVEAPRDEFYELADTRGFLLWQDFTILPLSDDDESREISRREATATLKRLKHHPSVVAWCGGNEAAMWHHPDYDAQLRDRGPWPGLVAATDVGDMCRRLDPERHYQPSTPFYGDDPNNPQEGNTHGYTNMWFVPGYDYLNFAAEDTRIAAPVLHSLERFMAPGDIWPADYSAVLTHGNIYPFPKSWLNYTTSLSWKKTGPVEQFFDPADAASLVHRIGMAEGLYYQDVIERQRRGRAATDPLDRRRCGGYLVWKFNDSWPQIYSGKVDYFLEPYHAYYSIRRAFAPVLLSFDIGAYIYLWAVNDSPRAVNGEVRIQLFHLERNEVRKEIVREVSVPPGRSQVVVRLDEAGIGAFKHNDDILFATLRDKSGRVIARTNALASIERHFVFPDATLDLRIEGSAVVITTDKFARTVTLTGDAGGEPSGWFFEDNYFDLLPGETKRVRILGRHSAGRISAKPWYSPHESVAGYRR